MPSAWTFALQVIFCLMVEDLVFYFAHRLLHTRWLYACTHKIHHEYKNPIAIAAIHVHPFEFVIGNVLP